MKHLLLFSGVACLAGAFLFSAQPVHAAAAGTAATSKATLTVTGSANPGALTLDKAPNFTFTESLDNLSNSVTGKADGPIQVTDARGTGAGWSLTAQLGDFTDAAKAGWNMGTGTNTVAYVGKDATDKPLGAAPVAVNATLMASATSAAATIMTAAPAAGLGTWTDTLSAPVLNTGTLQPTLTNKTATITWNLSDTTTTSTK